MRRAAPLAAAVVMVMAWAAPVSAGGSWMYPVQDRYEPGDVATVVGYFSRGANGWIEDGPFFAFLRGPGEYWSSNSEREAAEVEIPLGELSIDIRSGLSRASISFAIPEDLPAGGYDVTYCNAACTEQIGDLIGGFIFVGVDPPGPLSREWPESEPEIANLADDAVITGRFGSTTAGELRGVAPAADQLPPETVATNEAVPASAPGPPLGSEPLSGAEPITVAEVESALPLAPADHVPDEEVAGGWLGWVLAVMGLVGMWLGVAWRRRNYRPLTDEPMVAQTPQEPVGTRR